jgi:hypothetical protein
MIKFLKSLKNKIRQKYEQNHRFILKKIREKIHFSNFFNKNNIYFKLIKKLIFFFNIIKILNIIQ